MFILFQTMLVLNLINVISAVPAFHTAETLKFTSKLFMKEINPINVKFVAIALLKKENSPDILPQFMKRRGHIRVTYVMGLLHQINI